MEMTLPVKPKRIAVVGGGPAGIIAAATAAQYGARVVLFERNEKLGKKLYITGKGRCNITNTADDESFMSAVLRNPRFMFSAFNSFSNKDIIEIIESHGVRTKVERGGRVFPESDKSSDVISAFVKLLKERNVDVQYKSRVKSITKNGSVFTVELYWDNALEFDAVIIATGGCSYSATGSSGDGYGFAQAMGHTVINPAPSLVPLETVEHYPQELQGLALKNVRVDAFRGKRLLYSEMGEMLFTHFGISGPLILTLSGYIADKPEGVRICIDLKPALDYETLDRRVLSDFRENTRKQFKNSLGALLPSRLISVIIGLSGINPEKAVDDITRAEREQLCRLLKCLELTVSGTRPIEEAIITRGGVNVKEINPSTMESKTVSNLFFAGEVLDIDAKTGGYNLQIAYSTGYLAGYSAVTSD